MTTMKKLQKKMMVDVKCLRCGTMFEELIEYDGEGVNCPECNKCLRAYVKGRGVHSHNRSMTGSASSWKV